MTAPPAPRPRLCVGVTGHREDNPSFTAQRDDIVQALDRALTLLDTAVRALRAEGMELAPVRLHSLLADGADFLAAEWALAHGWDLVAPLPFGMALNVAINAHPATPDDAHALLRGADNLEHVRDDEARARAARLFAVAERARRFELADRDELLSRLYIDRLAYREDARSEATFGAESSLRVALASRVMIEQSDLLVAVWDGATRALVGGTGHTIQAALEAGTPVLWIDARDPRRWSVMQGLESLVNAGGDALAPEQQEEAVARLVARSLPREGAGRGRHRSGQEAMAREHWHARSRWPWHAYRRTEALFGATSLHGRFRNLTQAYETPDQIAGGSAAPLLEHARALPGQEPDFVERIAGAVLRRFAWADGVSARLSDVYRGGMTASFLFALLAVVVGVAYLPLHASEHKWVFALCEMLLLLGILLFTLIGGKRHWHGRWFETRRVAEYLRHGPILLQLGVARAPGRWPQGTDTSWPERYARNALREVGLPRLVVSKAFLRQATRDLLLDHVATQRRYHEYKARRLTSVHHNLDRTADWLFVLALVSVATYLVFKLGGVLHWWPKALAAETSYLFTFLGVLLPTLGGALGGIRYFGDFERFAAISKVTAGKLAGIETRIEHLLRAPEDEIDYGGVADLAHSADEVVVTEIESWQAVFAGKHVTVPV